MKRGADPHGVGVDQFFDDVGALLNPALHAAYWRCGISRIGQFLNKLLSLRVSEPLTGSVSRVAASRAVQVVQGESAIGVGADGGVAVM